MNTPFLLPPSSRDFEIHRLSLIEHLSTRRLAELHNVSQTRVRQIVYRVCQWLAQVLPVQTEAELEQEKRLAIHLAAAQLQHQIEQLQTLWDATYNPKYIRQKDRSILALARLGAIPGAIDSLAADIADGMVVPSCHEGPEAAQSIHPAARPPDDSFSAPLPGPDGVRGQHSPPPLGDCSPSDQPQPVPIPSAAASAITNPSATAISDEEAPPHPDALAGLNLIEQRLLTLLSETDSTDLDRQQSLQNTLATVRQEKTVIEVRISPQEIGATLQSDLPTILQPETQAGQV